MKSAAKRSAALSGLLVASHIPYKKPEVTSFFGVKKAYAQGTSGHFSLGFNTAILTPALKKAKTQSLVVVDYNDVDVLGVNLTRVDLWNGAAWINVFEGSTAQEIISQSPKLWPGVESVPLPFGTYDKIRIKFSKWVGIAGQVTLANSSGEIRSQEITYYTTTSRAYDFSRLVAKTSPSAETGTIDISSFVGQEEPTIEEPFDPVEINSPADTLCKFLLFDIRDSLVLEEETDDDGSHFFTLGEMEFQLGECPD
ncbi:hypothetical protein ACFLRM_05155 [Acidobacteriota bacterium]